MESNCEAPLALIYILDRVSYEVEGVDQLLYIITIYRPGHRIDESSCVVKDDTDMIISELGCTVFQA